MARAGTPKSQIVNGQRVMIEPRISAPAIVNQTPRVELPQPKASTDPQRFVDNLEPAIKSGADGIVRLQTEEANRRNDVLGRILDMDSADSQGLYDRTFRREGGTANLAQLTDANTRLATLQGKFRTARQATSSAPGQSQAFEGVQLSELSRQEAVEVGNQALLVQALQGNVETARQIALDTVNFATEDRKVELDNLIAQYDALNGIVSGQEAQVIEQRKEAALAERDGIERTREAITGAIESGQATIEEVQQLTGNRLTDAEKFTLASQIVARARGIMFDIETTPAMPEADGKAYAALESTMEQIDTALNAAEIVQRKIEDGEGFNAAVGFGLKKSVLSWLPGVGEEAIEGTQRADFEREVERLKGALTLPALQQMRGLGAMTEKEFATLSASVSALNTNMSEKAFKEEMQRILDTLVENKKRNAAKRMELDGFSPEEIQQVTGQTTSVSIPKTSRLAYVNNNPGNLRFAGQAGATRGEGGFARFSSPQAGYEALERQVALDASRGLTLQQFISKYAPPSENDTQLYVRQVASSLGASPSSKLSQLDLSKLARAVAKKESSTTVA